VLSKPLIGVVVVNYFGGDRTTRCLEAVLRSTWPADRLQVVLVDNGSEPGFVAELRDRLPAVRVVTSPTNAGFAGGANLGITSLPESDAVALINNDAIPEPGWLEPLVDALGGPHVGAATPKVLLDRKYVPVVIEVQTRRHAGDPRPLGVQLCGARVGGIDTSHETELARGFWGWEHDEVTTGGTFAWTSERAEALVAVPLGHQGPLSVELRLACGTGPTSASVTTEGDAVGVEVGIHPAWHTVAPAAEPAAVVNNAGTVLLPRFEVADRGYLEVDRGQFDERAEVFGWSGAAVLLARRYLDDVGLFDGRYFLYFEDSDLSWRGRLRGWRYLFEPTSVVHHERSATVGTRSAMAHHLLGRNRLSTLTKCAPAGAAVSAVSAVAGDLARSVWVDILRRLLTAKRPVVGHTGALVRVLGGYVRHLPGSIGLRRRIRRSATTSDREILGDGIPVPATTGR
jgi:GT2 family glycosyltransferase